MRVAVTQLLAGIEEKGRCCGGTGGARKSPAVTSP
jgi:hypothetical protein